MAKYPAGFLTDSFARAISPVEPLSLSVEFQKAAEPKSTDNAPYRGYAPRTP